MSIQQKALQDIFFLEKRFVQSLHPLLITRHFKLSFNSNEST